MKKNISIVMSLILCISLLAACGSNNTAGTAPSSSEVESNISSSEVSSNTPMESPEVQVPRRR